MSFPYKEQLDVAIEEFDKMHSYLREQLRASPKSTEMIWGLILSEYIRCMVHLESLRNMLEFVSTPSDGNS